nr:predicted GPI-anchored protein 58 [Nicotiana tomentosiformis]
MPRDYGTYSGAHAQVAARHSRGYMSRPVHSALPASSGFSATPRQHASYYAPPLSSAPSAWGSFTGQSSRPSPSQPQQPRTPRAYFERVAPPQTTQALRIPSGPQVSQSMVITPVSTPHAQPARGCPKGEAMLDIMFFLLGQR